MKRPKVDQRNKKSVDSMIAERALKLRVKGLSISEISKKLDISQADISSSIKNTLKIASDEIAAQSRESILALELLRLDQLQSGLWDEAISGNRANTETLLRVMDSRSKLMSLSADTTTNTSHTVVVSGDSRAYIDSLKAADGGGDKNG